MHVRFWWGDLRERGNLLDVGVNERIILKWIFKKWYSEVRTGLICLRIRTGNGLL